ncbi:MAG TPA: hypothetical protein PLA68_09430, partial [Panacibacter sp.]|nr:hypothetical protein [Panacibacter sp.]
MNSKQTWSVIGGVAAAVAVTSVIYFAGQSPVVFKDNVIKGDSIMSSTSFKQNDTAYKVVYTYPGTGSIAVQTGIPGSTKMAYNANIVVSANSAVIGNFTGLYFNVNPASPKDTALYWIGIALHPPIPADTTVTRFGAITVGKIDIKSKIKSYRNLGVTYIRDNAIIQQGDAGSSYNTLWDSGFKVILNLQWGVVNSSGSQQAIPFPTNLDSFELSLRKFFVNLGKRLPFLAVWETEPTNRIYHTGTMQDYLNAYKVFIRVCHEYK